MRLSSLGWEGPLEKSMATHSSIFAWRILWTEEFGRLHFMGCKELNKTEATQQCICGFRPEREPLLVLSWRFCKLFELFQNCFGDLYGIEISVLKVNISLF